MTHLHARLTAVWLLLATLVAPDALASEAPPFPYCPPGTPPRFVLGFARLKEHLGSTMGEPVECEHTDPVTGHTWQRTTTGLAFSHARTAVLTFSAGYHHWTLNGEEVFYWDAETVSEETRLLLRSARAASALPATNPASAPPDRQPPTPDQQYPLNGRFLLLNMHGALFHEPISDFAENVAYAQWLGAGVIRVFATDSNTFKPWDGRRVGQRIADLAPVLRAANVKLLVALVNNHRPVPGEHAESFGWIEGYDQLLLPFYTHHWRGAYLTFVRDLISTVRQRGAVDVIQAWEIGNELHTPQSPGALVPFVLGVVAEIRALDPYTPIYPGTMGANHLQPWNARSPIARWLYCAAPVDAYTLHAYDWVSRQRSGDMPIEWDLDAITAEPCPSGRRLPVIVEELGTSRALPGIYAEHEEERRLAQELRQLRFVLGFPQVQGVGVWNALSPRVVDRTFYDHRRGLTSYGPERLGGGSCYDPRPIKNPGVRCRLEQILQGVPRLP